MIPQNSDFWQKSEFSSILRNTPQPQKSTIVSTIWWMHFRTKDAILLSMKTQRGKHRPRLNMYESSVFAIRIQGEIGKDWSKYFGAQSMSVEADEAGFAVTTLISEPVDQAALIGMALPLVSVECLPTE